MAVAASAVSDGHMVEILTGASPPTQTPRDPGAGTRVEEETRTTTLNFERHSSNVGVIGIDINKYKPIKSNPVDSGVAYVSAAEQLQAYRLLHPQCPARCPRTATYIEEVMTTVRADGWKLPNQRVGGKRLAIHFCSSPNLNNQFGMRDCIPNKHA